MLIKLHKFYDLCESIIGNYCIFVEAESVLYDDYGDFIGSHADLHIYDFLNISLCINNGCFIQINVVINNGK